MITIDKVEFPLHENEPKLPSFSFTRVKHTDE